MRKRFWLFLAIIISFLDTTIARVALDQAYDVQDEEPQDATNGAKIMFVPQRLKDLSPKETMELTSEFGMDLGDFRRMIATNQQEEIANNNQSFHHVVKRQLRAIVVRCCGGRSCMPTARRRGGSTRPPKRPWQFEGAVAVAEVRGKGVTIACSNCAQGWQNHLNYGHGTGFIPIVCPDCEVGWEDTLGMGPGVVRDVEEEEEEEEEEGEEYYEDDEVTTTTAPAV